MTSIQLESEKNYEIIELLGAGNFGTVLKIQVKEDKKIYALKKIFIKDINIGIYLKNANIEFELLTRNIPNVLKGYGCYYDEKKKCFNFTTELMSWNLESWIENIYLEGDLKFYRFRELFTDILNGRLMKNKILF